MNLQTRSLCIGILTKNEARRIAACIQSAHFADHVAVVGSSRTGQNARIAESLGAGVHVYADWQAFGEQRNRLLADCTDDYIFFLDADEIIRSELALEIQAAAASGGSDMWETRRLEAAFGRPLKRLRSRKSLPRFFKRNTLAGFEGVVHEHAKLVDGSLARHQFQNSLLHYSRETIHNSLKKLTQYAMLAAAKRAKNDKRCGVARGLLSAGLMFSGSPVRSLELVHA